MCGRRVGAAVVAAAVCFLCGWCLSSRTVLAGDDDDISHLILFSGRDLWRNGLFSYGGLILSPGGFDQSGFLLKAMMSGGIYRYDASNLGGAEVIGIEYLTQVAPGFLLKRDHFEGKFFFGPEWRTNWLWPDDPDNRLRGHTRGLQFATELWFEPTPQTMLAGDASLSSIDITFTARLAYGWHVNELFDTIDFYTGPETQLYGGDGYRQWRFGLHVTSMKTGNAEWSAAGGWSIDSDRRSSPYVRLNLLQRILN